MHASQVAHEPAGRPATGYLHPGYALSHAEFGTPLELPRSGAWIIERPIPGFACSDTMGCYPLFACADWSRLHLDLDELAVGPVSLAVVTDPFGDYDEGRLRQCFPDLAIPFKKHYVVDLSKPVGSVVSKHHRYEARKALRALTVQLHPDPPAFLDEWMELHGQLVARHRIKGVAAFSRAAFARQFRTPGLVLLWAGYRGAPVAALTCFVHGEAAYAHILGCADAGYAHGALYALLWSAIDHFAGSVRWLDLMGVPGARDAGSEGIRRFKRGWTGETRPAWLCGRIFDKRRYAAIVNATGTARASYFPAYRAGEMA